MPNYHTTLSGHPVVVEYDYEKAEKQTRDHPGRPAVLTLNRVVVTPTIRIDCDDLHPEVVRRWEEVISDSMKED